jgi:lipopolysaccharide export system protein LptA
MRSIISLLIFVSISAAQTIVLKHADIHRSVSYGPGVTSKYLEGSVHLVMDTLDLYADVIEFRDDAARIFLRGGVKIISPGRVITSESGVFYPSNKLLELNRRVMVRDSSALLKTGKGKFYLKSGLMLAPVPVKVWPQREDSYLEADSGKAFSREGHYIFTGNAYFFRADTSADTLKVWADRFDLYQSALEMKLIARGNVKIRRKKLDADCRKAEFYRKKGTIFLTGDPTARWNLSDLVGDTIIIELDSLSEKPAKLVLKGGAEILSPLDTTEIKENYLSGQKIVAHFRRGKINWLEADDNAISRYYLEAEDSTVTGLNNASADTIRMFMKEGKIDSVDIRGGVEGIYKPE